MIDRADRFIAFTPYQFVAFTIIFNCDGSLHLILVCHSLTNMVTLSFFAFFIQNYRFLYHGDQKISWWTSMQVAGSQLQNPPVKFRQERWLHIWRSISIQHIQMEAGLNSDPGNDSFWDKIRDAKHVDRSAH